jgi:hypothetical protein
MTAMLTVSPSSSASRRPALLRDVDTARDRSGEPHDAEAEPVLPSLTRLLHQPARLQRTQQTEGGGLVHVDLTGDLTHTCLTALREDLQHADGTVDRLHPAGR